MPSMRGFTSANDQAPVSGFVGRGIPPRTAKWTRTGCSKAHSPTAFTATTPAGTACREAPFDQQRRRGLRHARGVHSNPGPNNSAGWVQLTDRPIGKPGRIHLHRGLHGSALPPAATPSRKRIGDSASRRAQNRCRILMFGLPSDLRPSSGVIVYKGVPWRFSCGAALYHGARPKQCARRPYFVVLWMKLKKAHPDYPLNVLLQVADEG